MVGWLKPIQLITIFGMVAMVVDLVASKSISRTPHDLMLVMFSFIVVTSAVQHTFMELLPVLFSQFIRLCEVRSVWRSSSFLLGRNDCSAIGHGSRHEVGFDPVGSKDVVQGTMKGRLVFNTSIFNNVNALGHSVVPAIPLVYFLLIWKRPVFVKILGLFLLLLPAFCVFNTQSKGSFSLERQP